MNKSVFAELVVFCVFSVVGVGVCGAKPSGDTIVYWGSGKRCHVKGCRRLTTNPDELAKMKKMTLAEAEKKGIPLCSRCPGSTTAGKGNPQGGAKTVKKGKTDDGYGKYGRKGAKARKVWLKIPAKDYDPNTKVYCDALWMRVHEENCPMLVLKDMKKTMTLEQADKEGWRIGETGQSGRERCCFKGYRRKYPEKEITDDAIGVVQKMENGKYKFHMAGCHRFQVQRDNKVMTLKEAKALPGFYMCPHCIERGPSVTTVSAEGLANLPVSQEFVPPAGWTPKPFSADVLPSKTEIDILVDEALCQRELADTPYINPLAMLEEFMGRRFFFGYSDAYKLYRVSGDRRLLDRLLESARYFHNICVKYPAVAQQKARNPEHMNYLFPMAGWSRITLQLARKYPDQVSQKEIAEAGMFLKDIVSALKSTWEGDDNLDPDMGIPKPLADDFRTRAFNRAMNGIGTLSLTVVALEDLQALKKTKTYQKTIDRYRRGIQEKMKHWKEIGCLYTEEDGRKYFYYPYAATDKGKTKNGLKFFGSEDVGHFCYSVSGTTLIYESVPELGMDDDFMTAIANAVYHNSGTRNGSIQCPSADKIRPLSRHPWNPNPKASFYVLEAFRDGLIDAQCRHVSAAKKVAVLSSSRSRAAVLYGQYFKALRKDRTLIHLGETLPRVGKAKLVP